MKNTILHIGPLLLMAIAIIGSAASASESKQAQSALETIPFRHMKQWLHFTRADLDEIAVESGQLDFSSRFAYEGDYSLRWKYQPGSTLTWNCNCDQLGRVPTFYFTALEPQIKGRSPSTFRIQFLDAKHNVACQCDMPLVRRYWNRCILRLIANIDGNGGNCQVGIKNLVGVIPDKVSAVRIIPLSRTSGEVFLGGWILTKEWMLRRTTPPR